MTMPLPLRIASAAGALVALKRRLAMRTRLRQAWRVALRRRFGWRALSNLWQDRRFGGYCGGTIASAYEHLGATAVQSTDYAPLVAIFESGRVPIGDDDVLVDLGCGKGRVLNYWLRLGRGRRLVGIELDERIAAQTRARLKPHAQVQIVTGGAIEQLPADGTLFYMFNPFEAPVVAQLKQALDALAASRKQAAPAIRVVYYYCRHADVFENDPAWRVAELPTGDHHRAVLIERVGATDPAAHESSTEHASRQSAERPEATLSV